MLARLLNGYRLPPVYTSLWCFIAMVLVGITAAVSHRPFIFPSLGPTAIMLFANPLDKNSAPRHVVVGHFIGAASGYFALAVTGLLAVPLGTHVGSHRVAAAAISLALTALLMMVTKTEHAPAGATTLIVALGILPRIVDFLFLMIAVILLTLLGLIVNRANRIEYPLWNR
jgi:CBS domain-containing membrane protein